MCGCLKMEKIKKNISKGISNVSQTYTKVQHEIRKNIATAILAAFAFIIALVWRDAIQSGVNKLTEYLKISSTGYVYNIITALVVTIICVLGIMFFSKWGEKK